MRTFVRVERGKGNVLLIINQNLHIVQVEFKVINVPTEFWNVILLDAAMAR